MNTTDITSQIVDILAAKLALEGELTASSSFAELELDSLVMLELSVVLEQKFGVNIPEDELVEAGSVDGVVALLAVAA